MYPRIQLIWHGDHRVNHSNMWWPHSLTVEYRIFPNFEIVQLIVAHHCHAKPMEINRRQRRPTTAKCGSGESQAQQTPKRRSRFIYI